jgi:hypothetical protein
MGNTVLLLLHALPSNSCCLQSSFSNVSICHNIYSICVGEVESLTLWIRCEIWDFTSITLLIFYFDSSGSRQGPVKGSHGHNNEPSGSMKCWELFEWLSNCWLVYMESALCSQSVSQIMHFSSHHLITLDLISLTIFNALCIIIPK